MTTPSADQLADTATGSKNVKAGVLLSPKRYALEFPS